MKADPKRGVAKCRMMEPSFRNNSIEEILRRELATQHYAHIMITCIPIDENKTRTSKVGAISKAQKAEVFKIVRRGALGFLKIQFVAKDQKIEG